MKNKQLLRSAATVVATGLTLLATNNSQAGRGPSGTGIGGGRGSMNNGAMHQSIGNRGMTRVTGANSVIGHNRGEHRATAQVSRRDNHGGRGERERERRHGKDDGRRHDLRDDKGGHGERERERRHGKDDGRGHDLRDDKGGRGEREHRHGEREPGDDRGRF